MGRATLGHGSKFLLDMTQFKTLGIDQAKLYACAVILSWGVILRKSFSKPEILCK